MVKNRTEVKKINKVQAKIINDNIKAIYDIVNRKFVSQPDDIKEELYSHGFVEICNHIHNFDPDKDNIYSFMNNVLGFSLNNYFYREILGYKSKYTESEMTNEDDKEMKQLYDMTYEDECENWKNEFKIWNNFKIEWEKHYSEPFEMEKPIKPNRKYFCVQKRVHMVGFEDKYVGADTTWNVEKDDEKHHIQNAIRKLSPIKQKFIFDVYYKGKDAKSVVKNINIELTALADEIREKVELCDKLNIPRTSVLKQDKDNILKSELYSKLLDSNISVDVALYRTKARESLMFFKDRIFNELRKEIKIR